MHKKWVQSVNRLCLFVVLKCVRLFTEHASYPYVCWFVNKNLCFIKQFVHYIATAQYTSKMSSFNLLYGGLCTQSTPPIITTKLNN